MHIDQVLVISDLSCIFTEVDLPNQTALKNDHGIQVEDCVYIVHRASQSNGVFFPIIIPKNLAEIRLGHQPGYSIIFSYSLLWLLQLKQILDLLEVYIQFAKNNTKIKSAW